MIAHRAGPKLPAASSSHVDRSWLSRLKAPREALRAAAAGIAGTTAVLASATWVGQASESPGPLDSLSSGTTAVHAGPVVPGESTFTPVALFTPETQPVPHSLRDLLLPPVQPSAAPPPPTAIAAPPPPPVPHEALIRNEADFAHALLEALGAPETPQNVQSIVNWSKREGGEFHNRARFNPLNTTLPMPGATAMNGVGVKAYTSWPQGVAAAAQTLTNGYGHLVASLRSGQGLSHLDGGGRGELSKWSGGAYSVI